MASPDKFPERKTPSHAIETTPEQLDAQEKARVEAKIRASDERHDEAYQGFWKNVDQQQEAKMRNYPDLPPKDAKELRKALEGAQQNREKIEREKATKAKLVELIRKLTGK